MEDGDFVKKSELKRQIQGLKKQFNTTGKNKVQLEGMLKGLKDAATKSGVQGSPHAISRPIPVPGTQQQQQPPREPHPQLRLPVRTPGAPRSFPVAQNQVQPRLTSGVTDDAAACSQNVFARLYK